MDRNLPSTGRPSPRYGHLGLWVFSLGPRSPVPGERLQLALVDNTGTIARRFEQIEGRCLDQGWVDFFLSAKCRPAVYEMPLVDIAPDGSRAVLCPHYNQSMGPDLYLTLLGDWCRKYGNEGWAL